MQRMFLSIAVVLAFVGDARSAMQSAERALLLAAARSVHDAAAVITAEEWARAQCVAAFPRMTRSAAGGRAAAGGGVVSCRAGGRWSAPAFVQLTTRSESVPTGVDTIDVVLLVMNEQGAQRLLQTRVTFDGETTVAAGPLASGEGKPGFVSYAMAGGRSIQLSLSGAVLRSDSTANAEVYGRGASAKTVLASTELSAPTDAHDFLRALIRPSPAVADETSARGTTGSGGTSARGTSGVAQTATPLDDLRPRIVEIQQTLDRLLAGTADRSEPSGAPPAAEGTVAVERTRLLQIRAQLDALLAALNRR